MQEMLGIVHALGSAFLTSPLGAAEFMLGIVVGLAFLACAFRGRERAEPRQESPASFGPLPSWRT